MTAKDFLSLPITYREYEFSQGFPMLLMQGVQISDHVDFIHFHNCIEVALCEKGSMTWNLENTYRQVDAGDFLFLPPFYTHASFFPPQEDTDVCCHYLFFNPQEALAPFYPKGLPEEMLWYRYADFPKIFRASAFQEEAVLIRLIIKTIMQKEEYCLQTVSGLLETLLVRLYRWNLENYGDSGAERPAECRPENLRARLFPAISYMDREYAREPDVALLAQLCGLSGKQFLTYFRSGFRQTPLQYLRGVRIRKACYFLISTEDSILSIALDTGFQSHSGFNRTFREIMGCSPQAFRNEKREILKSAPRYAPYKASGEIGVES
ncbi:MAG: AraC family transcriptional regulator [Blautia sp.]|nr:AraC family transcriptional regulator [Blautia sp.]